MLSHSGCTSAKRCADTGSPARLGRADRATPVVRGINTVATQTKPSNFCSAESPINTSWFITTLLVNYSKAALGKARRKSRVNSLFKHWVEFPLFVPNAENNCYDWGTGESEVGRTYSLLKKPLTPSCLTPTVRIPPSLQFLQQQQLRGKALCCCGLAETNRDV